MSAPNTLNNTLIVDINSKEFQSAQLAGSKIDDSNHVTIGIKQTIDGKAVTVRDWCFIVKESQFMVKKDDTNGLTGLKIPLAGEPLKSFESLQTRLNNTVLAALKLKGITNAVMEPSITTYNDVSSLKLKFVFDNEKNNTLFRDETCAKDSYLEADESQEYKDARDIDLRHPLVQRMCNYGQKGHCNLLIQPNGANMVPSNTGPAKVYLSWKIKMLTFNGSKFQPENVDLRQFTYNKDFVVPTNTFDPTKVTAMESNSKTGAQLESCMYNFGYNPLAASKKLLLELPLELSTMGIEKVQPYNPTQGKAPAKKAVKSKAPEPKSADKYVMNISFPLNEANQKAYDNILGLQKWLDTYMKENFSIKTKGGEVSTEANPKHPELFKTQVPFMREPKLSKKGDATYVSLKLSVPTYDFPIFDDNGKAVDKSEFTNTGTPGTSSMKPLPFRVNIIVSPLIWMTKAMGYGIKLYVARIDKVSRKSSQPIVHNSYSASLLDDEDMPAPATKEVVDVVVPESIVLDDDEDEVEEEEEEEEDDDE